MKMYLITKWFGIFLFDNTRIIKKHLFSKNYLEIAKKLIKIEKNEILSEEKEIIKNIENNSFIVNEKRLRIIGEYKPDDQFFKKINLDFNKFKFSFKLLLNASLKLGENKIEKELKSKDYQIIQMVKSLDSLINISNLLSERLDNWLIIYSPKYKIAPFKKIIGKINREINRLENQIKIDINKISPNCSKIIGSIITARLIALAGNMENLAKMPASTIQLLGAENAFFRFRKEGGKNPKHGIIFQHKIINQSPKILRGKISRLIASKISIAIKADYYTKRDISKILKDDIKIRMREIKKL
jgi:nucleolar protein 56